MKNNSKDGFIIALSWPDTYCKQAGAWYDEPMNILGFSYFNYYKVGHAALVLVDAEGVCKYFDFGRYHAPKGYGRVRSEKTDFDLKMNQKAMIQEDKILNIDALLDELYQRKACHGDGKLVASYTRIKYQKSLDYVLKMQENSPLPYGVFVRGGSNCARFVRKAVLKGTNNVWVWSKIFIPYSISPSPLGVVRGLPHQMTVGNSLSSWKPNCKPKHLESTLPKPILPSHLPINAVWHAGEGAGSWFCFEQLASRKYLMQRYSPNGKLECSAEMLEDKGIFEIDKEFTIEYLSHCNSIILKQKGELTPMKATKNISVSVPI